MVQSSRSPIESAMVPSRCMEDILRGVLQQAAYLEGRIALLHCKKKFEIWRMYQSYIILHKGISGNETHFLSSLFGSILAFVALLGTTRTFVTNKTAIFAVVVRTGFLKRRSITRQSLTCEAKFKIWNWLMALKEAISNMTRGARCYGARCMV